MEARVQKLTTENIALRHEIARKDEAYASVLISSIVRIFAATIAPAFSSMLDLGWTSLHSKMVQLRNELQMQLIETQSQQARMHVLPQASLCFDHQIGLNPKPMWTEPMLTPSPVPTWMPRVVSTWTPGPTAFFFIWAARGD